MNKKWYALYVHSRQEKKVAKLLSMLEIENYLPLQRITRQWSDRKKVVEEPLFRSYVFIRIEESIKEKIRNIDGVLNFVYWLGKPAVIKDAEILVIREFLNEYENIEVQQIAPRLNSTVSICEGPFTDQVGKVIMVGKHKVKVLIESMGFMLLAEVPITKVLNLSTKK